jgi:AraC-like DNA-binding protein
MTKPVLEEPSPSASEDLVVCEHVRGKDFGCVWHCHPECEITLVLKGGTERIVGDERSPIHPEEIVFLGPNLPHDFLNQAVPGQPHTPVEAIVVQFLQQLPGQQDWLQRSSMKHVRRLFERASQGLEITGTTRVKAARIMRRMLRVHGIKRIILMLHLLEVLASSEETREICVSSVRPSNPDQQDRIGKVCEYIKQHLNESIYVEELAQMVGLSRSAFSRLFTKTTGRSVPQHVNALRITHATRLLSETDLTVGQIAYECGFVSPAHFQREFRKYQQCAPLTYRNQISKNAW